MADVLNLYLVRHGQTAASLQNRFCGRIDPPLNATGRAMAESLAARHGATPWAEIVTSPLERAVQTATPTARAAGVALTRDPDLVEIAYGQWEGRVEEEVAEAEPAAFTAWVAHPGRVAPPGGETGTEIAVRALAAIDRIRQRHSRGNVLVVSHKATLRVLLCALLGIDLDGFRARIAQPVCGISVVEWRATGPFLQRLGDTSHLAPELLGGGT